MRSFLPRFWLCLPCAGLSLLSAAIGLAAPPKALPPEEIQVRGNKRHPCVNLTSEDVTAARSRIERYGWAREERDAILKKAAPWLEQTEAYWLSYLPKPGAAYAYGFTGCPVCNSRTGTWSEALCSWDRPGKVLCEKGHELPDAGHPDSGTGYVAPDGRKHYLVGQFNAWVVEQWTLNALPNLAQAYLLTGDERYAERGLLFLDALASVYKESTSGSWDYPSKTPSGRLARPLYQVARTLVRFADAYDWLYNSPAADRASLRPGMSRRDNIERCMLLDGARYCYEHSWGGALTNGHADYLRGALAVGCLLDIPQYIAAAYDGPFSISVMLANNIDRDGQYYESAPDYAIHARHLYQTFVEPLRNLRNAEHPAGINLYDDPRLQATITLPDLQIQVGGRRPNYGDCAPEATYLAPAARLFNASDYGFAERLYAMTTDASRRRDYGAVLRRLAGDELNSLRAGEDRNWLLWHAAEPPPAGDPFPADLEQRITGSWFAGAKGLATIRLPGQEALLRYGPSLYHGDPDDLALLYYANGYELSYDIGYGLATTHCQVGWASSTVSHAVVTVNEKNQLAGAGSGGSLHNFATLPNVRLVDADSPLSYASEGVREYRRALAFVSAGYLVDCFRVAGGKQHDYGFGSIGTALEPFGVKDLKTTPGSLAAGVAWGEKVGADGDIIGHPNRSSWNPPPGNGYGFFYNVRHAQPANAVWGGVWTVGSPKEVIAKRVWDTVIGAPTEHRARLRLHMVGDAAEPVYADAPGLYPGFPCASYVLARRQGQDLRSTFLAVYEPYTVPDMEPRLVHVERLGERAVVVHRRDGAVDLLLFGAHEIDSPYGRIEFAGDFAYLSGDGKTLARAELLGGEKLTVGGRPVAVGPAAWSGVIAKIDNAARAVEFDNALPGGLAGLTAIFSNPAWTRTSGYQIARVEGKRLILDATSLSLGTGRINKTADPKKITSDIPHEFTKTAAKRNTRYFDGKMVVGRSGGTTRITTLAAGAPLSLTVADSATLSDNDFCDYMDLWPGDQVRIALPQVWTAAPKSAGQP